jgi:hypothetical protein
MKDEYQTSLRFDVFTVVEIHLVIFWVMPSCSLEGGYTLANKMEDRPS